MSTVVANILDPKIEEKRKYARERARRLRRDPEYRALELARNRRWQEDNAEQYAESKRVAGRKWYIEHRDEKLEANAQWKREHPERVNELARERRAQKPDEVRAIGARCERKRRAIKRSRFVGDPIELAEYEALLANDPCCYCGASTEHIDHIDPLSCGGSHEWMNLTAACAHCNQRKHAKPLWEFLLCL